MEPTPDEIGAFLDEYGYDLLLKTGHTPLEDGPDRWSDEDASWLIAKTREPGFLEWALGIIDG